MDVLHLLRRLRTRAPSGERVELKPLEQVCLARIIETGGTTTAALQVEVDSRSPVLRQDAMEVVSALVGKGLAEARLRAGGDALFAPTPKGMRLRRRLPADPRSITDFWV